MSADVRYLKRKPIAKGPDVGALARLLIILKAWVGAPCSECSDVTISVQEGPHREKHRSFQLSGRTVSIRTLRPRPAAFA